MSLTLGTHVGPYTVIGALGSGGMGTVYRARDTRLERDVAIKVLPEAFVHDAERLARLRHEARLIATLNHPHIASIYDLAEFEGAPCLVLELVEGETLAERLTHGALPIGEALQVCRQVAEALEAAHDKGIVHRDLKPANIKITTGGDAKVLDFGLAKELAAGGTSRRSSSSAMTVAETLDGVLLGTAPYMSPQQARGRPVDRMADIWAFGCVLYETLTGRPAFTGDGIVDVISNVLNQQPDWNALPETTPSSIRSLLRQCVQKDPKHRLQHIGDARVQIDDALGAASSPELTTSVPRRPERRWRMVLAVAGAFVLGALLATVAVRIPGAPAARPRPTTSFAADLPPGQEFGAGDAPLTALSPAGTHLVYVGKRGGVTQLYVRPADRMEGASLPGTEGASRPFFSPDGQWVGFLAGSKLKKVPITGGTPATLCDVGSVDAMMGATWGTSGTIIFAPAGDTGLWQVPAAGGTPERLTELSARGDENSHRWPHLLPGDRALLFSINRASGNWDEAQIVVQSLPAGERRGLLRGADARYAPTGHLVYASAGNLMAAPFDVSKLELAGTPVPVLEGIMESDRGFAHFSFSHTGSLAYIPGGLRARTLRLVWVDRSGAAQPVGATPGSYFHPRLSQDGLRIAISIETSRAGSWVYDVPRGTLSRVTMDEGWNAIWTPDGKRLTFEARRGQAPAHIFWKASDGTGQDEPLTTGNNRDTPASWSPDGTVLAFQQVIAERADIWLYHLAERRAQPYIRTPFSEGAPMFGPDGKWLAYVSDETGRPEVYVQAYPGPGQKMQVSTEGGSEPMWARSGREIFYRNGAKMMAVEVRAGPSLGVGKPRLLFEKAYARRPGTNRANYDVTSDGRFLMIEAIAADFPTRLHFVTEWFADLERRVPVKRRAGGLFSFWR